MRGTPFPVPGKARADTSAPLLVRVRDDAAAWAAGRSWGWRAPLLLWMAYVGVRQFADAEYASLFAPLNLGIHEAGHLVFRALGDWFHAAGGTILQLAAPVAALVMFLRQPDWFAAALCLGWLSTNLHGAALYMADAEAMRLPLVTAGSAESVTHDWRFLFERADLLHRCETISALTRGIAHLAMAASLAAMAWLLLRMATAPRTAR